MDGIKRNYKDGLTSNNIEKQKFKTTTIYSAISGEYFWKKNLRLFISSIAVQELTNSDNLFCVFCWYYIRQVNITYSSYRPQQLKSSKIRNFLEERFNWKTRKIPDAFFPLISGETQGTFSSRSFSHVFKLVSHFS